MSPKVQALLLLVGLITFLEVHAEEELSETVESERSCAKEYQWCDWNTRPCCDNISCICSWIGTNCECKKGIICTIKDWYKGK
uniref:U16-lycotoxin-Ls1b n=1 Tax=Lycosa singoriensis TaxID=434756 RepID=TX24B_LYCSI|nr:RecName: Full=U16-lycotoxin-Ls1b; Short=U16-LCTX-Ls1b; AltName: Full=Toxin-like structure LSTX-P2; Flags: Precursor [Lycosa singoriensis]ACI41469.1 toxin-like structure LSTX-P2 precursor [Lycosa singoriensis]CAS03738.1 toxin-like structure LSTX-P2 precursor [Lycosa singoriensis]